MEKRRKRELRQLVAGVRDPRRGIGIMRGNLQQLTHAFFLTADEVGFGLLILISFPISVPLAIIGNSFWGMKGGLGGAIVGVVVFLAWIYKSALFEERVRLIGKEHDFVLCLWCQHPIVGLPKREVCSECGKGFDIQNSQKLYKAHFNPPPFSATKKVMKYRTMRDWARALRERDRVHNH